ncbi:TOMM precursor leader peptide-binding protein [Nonomuraea sp. NPDC049504]|uniref:TOMM precursor leader peptide-binding protein n=1 Tax=Nonomuraea sp. NPDC049504 TaxID=3154729 RepID=UPI0034121CDF
MIMRPPDLIVTVGAFGAAAARLLSGPATRLADAPPAGREIDLPPATAIVVLAASVPAPAVELELSRAAHLRDFAFLPVVLDHPRLRVGPVSRAGSRGCSTCYRNRVRQHAANVSAQEAVEEHHRRHPEVADRGYLAHWPALAAALAALAAQADPADTTRVRHLDLLSNTPLVSRLVPVHGCAVCAPEAAEAPQLRSIVRLRGIVEELETE